MTQFQGFICDECGAIIKAENRTRVKTRYEGPTREGDVKYDLCPDCTEAEITQEEHRGREVEPIKRRRKKKSADTASPQGRADDEQDAS